MRILIAAGSSGGHIFPAIATAFRLKEIDSKNEVFFVGTQKALDIDILKNGGYKFDTISSNKKIFKDLLRSFSILRKIKPDVAVGFGGYVSFPTLAAAKMMGISTLIHEQNLVPGLANRTLSNIVDRIGVSFKETRNFFSNKSRIRETGNPIRENLLKLKKEKALEIFDLDKELFTVLVMGGSQGARFVNDVVLEALKNMPQAQRRYFQFIHLSGLNDFEFVKAGYESLDVKGRVFSFCDRMSEVYSASDLVISRAGASSIAEITFFGLPSILIPYPNVKVHQVDNARFLEQQQAAIIIEQANFFPAYFKEVILNLMRDRHRLRQIAENVSRLSIPDAAHRLAMEIIDVARG
jgi:UDP-N-acetylglucosamine--N-acetylmuramyl-(pentapeptide) pyrophosphoryl-undecaprenol N-acetylglucosamine transferase